MNMDLTKLRYDDKDKSVKRKSKFNLEELGIDIIK